ncbi:lipoprotein [Succinimonas sp.]|uniref:LPS translocon maturation chaperone LptM n=1 Tax=Succinimonas sp. TaxID=1936151 RepID=UPI003868CB0F
MIKRQFFIALILMSLLSGCGLKGGLYLPEESSDEKTAEPGVLSEDPSLNPASPAAPADETPETDRE